GHELLSRSPPRARRDQFFASRSFRAALSSIDSASSFFSLRFSSSSDRRRLASDASSPPNFAFHLYSVPALIPCRRHTSSVRAPASCSRRTLMICSSVNLDLRMTSVLLIAKATAADSPFNRGRLWGAGHMPQEDQSHHRKEVLITREVLIRAQRIRARPEPLFDFADLLQLATPALFGLVVRSRPHMSPTLPRNRPGRTRPHSR